MSKRLNRPSPRLDARDQQRARSPHHSIRRAAAVGALVVVVLVAGFLGWRQLNRTPWTGALPPIPDLEGRPPALQARIDTVQAGLANRGGPSALVELASLYHANGFVAEADTCWRLMATEHPNNGRWPYYLADLARLRADDSALRRELDETVRREPTYSPAWLKLADLAFKSGQPDVAERAYRQRLEHIPSDPHARFGLARLQLQAGHSDAAEQGLRELLIDAPTFPSALNLLAQLLDARGEDRAGAALRARAASAGRFREAEDPWLTDLRAYCYDGYQLAVWGSQAEQAHQPEEARQLFERAIEVAPDDPVGYSELGELLLDQGRPEDAHAVLIRGLANAPQHEKLMLRLARALRDLGRAAEALALDQQGLQRAPGSFELLNSLGQTQTLLGELSAAEATFRQALRVAPQAPAARVNLGVVLLRLGRRAEAKQTLHDASAEHPTYPKLQEVLARLALEEGRLDQAEELLRARLEQPPVSRSARDTWSDLHLRRAMTATTAGDPAAAERWCVAGLAVVPENADLLALLGSLRLQRNDAAGALDAMERCQALEPGNPRVVLPLASLYRQLQRPADARRVLLRAREWLVQHGGAENVGMLDTMLLSLAAETNK